MKEKGTGRAPVRAEPPPTAPAAVSSVRAAPTEADRERVVRRLTEQGVIGSGDSLDELRNMIEYGGLGPTTSVAMIDVNGEDVLEVLIDPRSTVKAAALSRWLTLIDPIDVVDGKRHAGDRQMWLHLRGVLPSGVLVIVSTPYDEHTESAQAELIHDSVSWLAPAELVRRLVALDWKDLLDPGTGQ